jgi:hypothetical protein
LEIRDALGVKKNERISISFSAAQGDQKNEITVRVAKANGNENGSSCSKNVKVLDK